MADILGIRVPMNEDKSGVVMLIYVYEETSWWGLRHSEECDVASTL